MPNTFRLTTPFIATAIVLVSTSPVIATDSPTWHTTRRCGPFLVHSEFSLESHARALRSLASLPSQFHKTLDLPTTGQPIHLHLLSNRRRYREHVRTWVRGGTKRRALFLKTRDRAYVFAYRHDNWSEDLRHECTHALIHNALPFLPLWLDEGLAEYFEQPIPAPSAVHPHLGRLRWSMRLGWSPSLKRLESRRRFQSVTSRDYRESWAWVHFLLHGPPPARQALADYLTAIKNNKPPGHFSQFLETRLPSAASRVKTHLAGLSR
jgi:hypothetical protein